MPVTVKIPSPLRTLTAGAATVDCQPGTVSELIDELDATYPGFATGSARTASCGGSSTCSWPARTSASATGSLL